MTAGLCQHLGQYPYRDTNFQVRYHLWDRAMEARGPSENAWKKHRWWSGQGGIATTSGINACYTELALSRLVRIGTESPPSSTTNNHGNLEQVARCLVVLKGSEGLKDSWRGQNQSKKPECWIYEGRIDGYFRCIMSPVFSWYVVVLWLFNLYLNINQISIKASSRLYEYCSLTCLKNGIWWHYCEKFGLDLYWWVVTLRYHRS